MKKIASILLSFALLLMSAVFFASPAQAGETDVTFCHALGNGKYQLKTQVADEGIVNGHAGASHQSGKDIIPSFSWVDKKDKTRYYFDGQNLDKSYLLNQGCKENAVGVSVTPNAPTYAPPTCANPNLPWGSVTIPTDLGNGVLKTTPAVLTENRDKTADWSVTYTIKDNDDDFAYTWADGNPEKTTKFSFDAVNISTDPLWVIDSKTGEGHCELSNTGMSGINNNVLLAAGGLLFAGMVFLGVTNFIGRRRNA